MSLDSIVGQRLFAWKLACEIWDFDIDPPFSATTLGQLDEGEISFRAHRTVALDGHDILVTLAVKEQWRPGRDADDDARLMAHGCFLQTSGWHLQFGEDTGDSGAERLDTGWEDTFHPRIHRHPYGAKNDVRPPAEMFVPEGWLAFVNVELAGVFGVEEQWDEEYEVDEADKER